MACSDGKDVLERLAALNLATPSDAARYRESLDAVDLLDGPIWHIIFRCLLLPPTDSTQLQNQGNSFATSQQRSFTFSCIDDTIPLSAREQHEDNTWCYGSCWPLLFCAMASKRLLHHVLSFSELESVSLIHIAREPQWNKTLFWFLQQSGHKSLNVHLDFKADVFKGHSKDLQIIGHRIASSAHSLTSLSLDIKEPVFQSEVNAFKPVQLYPAFLGKFGQLQRLKLGNGRWNLGKLDAAWFRALRTLSIEYLELSRNEISFLSSISPQLHEFSLSSSSRGSTVLDFMFTVARVITVSFENQKLEVCFSLPASLETFSLTAASLHVDCKCNSPLSLNKLALSGCEQLSISSLPLASVKFAILNGPATEEEVRPRPPWVRLPGPSSRLALTHFLSSIAPTVETLFVRHGWPLEDVDVEWSRLLHLGIGVKSAGGSCHKTTVEDAEGCDWLNRGSSSRREVVLPPFINAPRLHRFYFPTRQFQPETLASLRRHFPSLAWYHIVGRLFHWEGKGEQRSMEPSVEVQDDWNLMFLQDF